MPNNNIETCAYISVTSLCNNDCIFCGLKEYGIRYQLSIVEVRKQLKHLRSYGARRIVFTGGEPTIHPQIIEIIRSASELGFEKIGIFTNGRGIKSAEFVTELTQAGLNSAMVSVHGGTAKTHDATVQSTGAFNQTIRGLGLLVAADLHLVVNTPVTSLNLHEIASMYDFLAAFGTSITRWQLSNLFPTAVVMNRPELHPGYEDIQEAIFKVMALSQTGKLRVVTQEFPLCIVFPWLNEARDLSDERKQMICRKDLQGDYRQYRPWSSPYKTFLPACEPCGMRKPCNGIPLCYLMSHRDLSIFRPLEYLSEESWRKQMGLVN